MAQLPEGEFYSRLYVEPGPPKEDSERFRNRLAAYFAHEYCHPLHRHGVPQKIGSGIQKQTGHQVFDVNFFCRQFDLFFRSADLPDVLSSITIVWRELPPGHRPGWLAFVDQVLKEENLAFRVDAKCGIHPRVDQEFDRNRVSAIECLAELRYAAVRHAADEAFDQLSALPMDGKAAARSIFEAAEALTKTITGSGADLTEGFVNNQLRPICDRVFADDPQLKSTVSGLLTSFGKWVGAVHPYRHGHEREGPLKLPDDVAILIVSQGSGFLRWLVDLDRQNQPVRG